ncbi:hypothetical protein L596_022678 [Steinernema carpocapsae]|uniref:Uncharacterized protein n=1 Tax=Steinernema carpocapsae TaxID=34508 RepID=A0A4U5MMC8_STECR|nr:hypothetical protein L596_022678 [Steinernema carpocapsae]
MRERLLTIFVKLPPYLDCEWGRLDRLIELLSIDFLTSQLIDFMVWNAADTIDNGLKKWVQAEVRRWDSVKCVSFGLS